MYELRLPREELRPYIENYWFVAPAAGEEVDLRVEVFVDARADLIINFGAPYRREVIGAAVTQHARSNFDAQRLYPIRIQQHGAVRIVGVRFHLGGVAPFARTALSTWSGATPEPAAVLGEAAEHLEVALSAAAGADEATAVLDRFFIESTTVDPARVAFERALTGLVEGQGRTPVGELADLAECSPRQLERLFAKLLGFPPRTVGRVLRFQQALRSLMTDPGMSLGAVAAECGYYDQAHFVRDFRLFSGGVPRGYRGYYPTSGPSDFAPNVVAFVQDTSAPALQAEGVGTGEETR